MSDSVTPSHEQDGGFKLSPMKHPTSITAREAEIAPITESSRSGSMVQGSMQKAHFDQLKSFQHQKK